MHLDPSDNKHSDKTIAKRIMILVKTPNKLQYKVVRKGWDEKWVIWEKNDDAKLENFQEITEDELRDMKMGVY